MTSARGRAGAAVLGSPIAHSLSPVLHRAAYDALGLTHWTYRAIECGEAELSRVLRSLDGEGLAGVSLTMPLKRAVLRMLASVETLAAEVGAANTVLFGASGQWSGFNTDVPGMVDALAGIDVPETATVLGSGATAASAVAALARLGVRSVVVKARGPGLVADIEPWPTAVDDELVVSTVPAGAADGLAVGDVRGKVLFDVVYAPWPTPLAAKWSAASGTVIGGLELLITQAAHQVKLMTGLEPPTEVMRRALGS